MIQEPQHQPIKPLIDSATRMPMRKLLYLSGFDRA
jgi:hypothetical protein